MGSGRPARFWSRRNTSPRFFLAFLVVFLAAFAGCGGATAPCPTPTSELDQLRTQARQLGQEVDQATAAERNAAAERDVAVRRLATARAALDSLNASIEGAR